MSKKFEICSATYDIALNHDEDDVFRTGCAHLYHFLHVNGNNDRSEECKPMMLKMHLELNKFIEETEEQTVEPSNSNNAERQFIQQLEAKFKTLEDALQASNADAVNKLMERMEKLENNISKNIIDKTPGVGNNTIDHDSNNVLLNLSDNSPIQSTLQLEAKLKTLEDALQANSDVLNKTMEFLEKKFEKNLSNNFVNKATDVGNNTINHDSNNALLSISDNTARQSVQQLEEKLKALVDALQAKDDIVNEIMDRLEKKLEKNLSNIIDNKLADVGKNAIAQETNNALLRISDNAPRLSAQQLEAKLKTLEDVLQAKDDAVHKIIERMEQLEKNLSKNFVNKATDVGNNTIDHENINALLSSSVNASRQSLQQFEKEVKDLKDRIEQLELIKAVNKTIDIGNPTTHDNSTDKEQQQATKHNCSQESSDNGNIESDDHNDGKEYQMTPKEKQEIQFDRKNLVSIGSIKSSDSSLETAIHNVIKYAKEIDLSLTRDQIKHIDVRIIDQNSLVYYVFFRTRAIKEAFLIKSDILKIFPHNLIILNESELKRVYIRNFKSSDLGEARAIVIGLANQMGLMLMRDQIKWMDVFRVNQSCLVCRVWFFTTQVEDEFFKKSHILKGLPETKSLKIY